MTSQSAAGPSVATKVDPDRQAKVLLVGKRLIEDAALRDELKRHGYLTLTARSEVEALTRLAGTTPDLVLSQYGLGRSDGASLVAATRALPGIERIPVVLLDESHHESRRTAARTVGAAGYMVNPDDLERFVAHLRPVIEAPGDRALYALSAEAGPAPPRPLDRASPIESNCGPFGTRLSR